MATSLDITVYRPASMSSLTSDDLRAAYAEVVEIDRLMSLYKADSELTALNNRNGEGAVPVSPKLFEVLSAASHYAHLSGGAFDATVQPLVNLWGFFRVEHAAIPLQAQIDAVMKVIGNDRMSLDASTRTLTLQGGTRVDLGGIAKGYAVDRALAVLKARGVQAALVNLGGNIGVLGRPPGRRPWVVGIQHPREPRLIGQIRFWHGAVATSGDYDRYFEFGGKRYSHLLDPRTGQPVEGIYSFTVVAPTATAADAFSTAAFVLGAERGLALLKGCRGFQGVAIEPNETHALRGGTNEPLLVSATSQSESSPIANRDKISINLQPDSFIVVRPIDADRKSVTPRDCNWPIAPDPG